MVCGRIETERKSLVAKSWGMACLWAALLSGTSFALTDITLGRPHSHDMNDGLSVTLNLTLPMAFGLGWRSLVLASLALLEKRIC